MEHNFSAQYNNTKLRPLERSDIEQLRNWRNDDANTKFLRKIGTISREQQEKWFENYLSNRTELIFAIEETVDLKRMVGSVSIYDVQGQTAEIGRILIGDTDAHGRGIGRMSLVMAMLIAFRRLNIDKIVATVHRENISSYTNHMRVGFVVTGHHDAAIGGVEDEMDIDLKRLLEVNTYASKVKIASNGRLAE